MNNTSKGLLYLLLLIFTPLFGYSQITIDQSYTVEEYVNEILLGEGILASNITLTGSNVQIGYMQGGEGTIYPLNGGLVLSCEDASNIVIGTNNTIPVGEGVSGDQDLLDIANSVPPMIGQNFSVSSVNDICALEFDFIASGDSLTFNYSFGSDEYLEWVNSSFNDIFAFFLSGPGIVGPYDSPGGFPDGAVNIAGVPGTDLPITISSVNNVLNDEYYIDNVNNNDIAQDGFTVKLTATHTLICGETYHIKLAIADGTDTALESIVVLEEGSFSSNGVILESEASLNDAPVFFGDSVLVEGCNDAVFTLFRPNANSLDTIYYNVGGTADIDDYTGLPPYVVMDTGVHEVDILLSAILDGLVEDSESILMSYTYVDACGDTAVSEASLWIMDYVYPEIFIPEEVTGCPGEDVTLTAEVEQGYEPFTWLWDTGSETNTTTVSPSETTTYSVVYTDVCGQSDSTDVTVNIGAIPPVELETFDVTSVCAGDQVTISVDVLDGVPSYDYDWSSGGNTESTDVSPNVTTTYEVTVTDNCGQVETAEVTVNVTEYDDIVVEAESTESICPGFELELSASAEGGLAPYTYEWAGIGEGSTVSASPNNETTYTVTVTDNCGVEQTGTVTAVPGVPPPLIYDPEIYLCFGVGSGPVFSQGVPFTDGPDYQYVYDEGITEINGTFSAGVGSYEVIAEDACGTTGTVDIHVDICEVEVYNVFTPGVSGGQNDIFEVKGANGFIGSTLVIYNRWGTMIYESANTSSSPKLSWDGEDYPEGTYYYTIDIKGENILMKINGGDSEIIRDGIVSGTFTLLR